MLPKGSEYKVEPFPLIERLAVLLRILEDRFVMYIMRVGECGVAKGHGSKWHLR